MSKDFELYISPYPHGKSFAFTVIDDTDRSTLENCKPVYEFLTRMQLRTTKTVWVREARTKNDDDDYGDTTEREEYLAYVKELQSRGFEIALHNVSSEDNKREETKRGIERFKTLFGDYPSINVMHDENKENLYFDSFLEYGYVSKPFYNKYLSSLYEWYIHYRKRKSRWNGPKRFFGEDMQSPYFWGDICKERIRYVRSYVNYPEINTLKCNPDIPYHEKSKPYVNYWFDSSNGEDCAHFNSLLSEENIKKVIEQRGCAIVYTHFGKGFVYCDESGRYHLNEETRQALETISKLDGWFMPVSTLLERLLVMKRIKVFRVPDILVINFNDETVEGVTLCTQPRLRLYTQSGEELEADNQGNIVIDKMSPNECIYLKAYGVSKEKVEKMIYWRDRHQSPTLLDAKTLMEKLGRLVGRK